MNEDTIKVKKLHPDAKLPTQANPDDAGYDVYAIDDGMDRMVGGTILYRQYRTGIAVEPPPGYHLEVVPRSSVSKTMLGLANSIGLIDNPYRGEICLRFRKPPVVGIFEDDYPDYKKGDKIGQILIRKTIHMEFVEVSELSDTVRGAGGFGSSGT